MAQARHEQARPDQRHTERTRLAPMLAGSVPSAVQIHDLRHVAATRMLSKGAGLLHIATLLREIADAVAADVAAPQERNGFSGPFNGQRRRQELFTELVLELGITSIVETGTYLGVTTYFMAVGAALTAKWAIINP